MDHFRNQYGAPPVVPDESRLQFGERRQRLIELEQRFGQIVECDLVLVEERSPTLTHHARST
jgi:hypothetical protein